MIRLELEEYCHNDCREFEPVVIFPERLYVSNTPFVVDDTLVVCDKKRRCERLVRYLEKGRGGDADGQER